MLTLNDEKKAYEEYCRVREEFFKEIEEEFEGKVKVCYADCNRKYIRILTQNRFSERELIRLDAMRGLCLEFVCNDCYGWKYCYCFMNELDECREDLWYTNGF